MRTTLNINDTLLKEAKKCSIERNCSLGEIVDEALRLSLMTQSKSGSTAIVRPLKTFAGSGIQPGVDLSSNGSILETMDSECS